MSPRARLTLAGALFLAALLFIWQGFVWRGFALTTDISAFIPSSAERQKAQLSKAIIDSELSRTWVLTIEADGPGQAAAASQVFESELRSDPALMRQLAFVTTGPPADSDRAVWELYQPRSLSFAAPDLAAAKELVSDDGLKRALTDLRARLESPLSTLVSRIAPEDPFLAVPRLFEQLQQGNSKLTVVDGRFISEERFAVLMFGTHASSFDGEAQSSVLAGVQRAAERAKHKLGELRLEMSSLALHSIHAERSIKADIQRITWVSVAAMLLLCWLLFGSLRLMLLALLPVTAGMLTGLTVILALYGQVHGLTLAVGASLIGVCIDYVVHFYAHHLLSPSATPSATMKHISMGLLLGCGTTAVGFLALAGSSFPGLRQIALFAGSGVLGALACTRWVVPLLVAEHDAPKALLQRVALKLESTLLLVRGNAAQGVRAQRRRGVCWLSGAALLSLAAVAMVDWQDDMSTLTRSDEQLLAEDERVRARVAQFDMSRFVIAIGADDESALQINDQVTQALRAAQADGALSSWQNISALLPSGKTQREVAEVLRSANLDQRLVKQLELAGFNSELFQPALERLRAQGGSDDADTTTSLPTPLAYEDLLRSDLAAWVRAFRVHLSDRIGFVTFLREVEDPDALGRKLSSVPGAEFIDQTQLIADASKAYRQRLVPLLLLGLGLVWIVLWARYRNLRTVAAAFVPAVLSAGVTLFVLSALGFQLNLLGLTTLLMVLSIGVDYGVFLTETVQADGLDGASLRATLAGLFIAWFSTVFGFGVLALSQHPALQIIGIVAAVGVTAALLLAPTALALLPAPQEARQKQPEPAT